MKTIRRFLATTMLFGLVCATPVFSCELPACDKDFAHDMVSLGQLSCGGRYYGRAFINDIHEICHLMCPGSCSVFRGDCFPTFRQDIKELIRLLCQGPRCPDDFIEDVQVLIRLICKQTECSLGCAPDYLKYADKLIQLSSVTPRPVALMGTIRTADAKKRPVISNRLLRVLEQANPYRFKPLRIALASGQVGRAARRSNTSLLMLASAMGNLHVVEELIANGAKVNAQNKMGQTALIFAASEGHPAVVQALLKAGADAHHKDKDGATAAGLAKEKGHGDLVKILVGKSGNK